MPLRYISCSRCRFSISPAICVWALSWFLGSVLPLQAATLRVPEDFPAIHLAIVAASSGDTVLVGPGTYDENLDTLGKRLTLIGSGAAVTIVDGGRRGSVLLISGGGSTEGFTFRRGQAQNGGGILVTGTVVTILRNNVIEDNIAGYFVDSGLGGGIFLDIDTDNTVVVENRIANNYAGSEGGGIRDHSVTAGNEIRDNVIVRNGCHVGGGGVSLRAASLIDNLISENWTDSFGGGVLGGGSEIRNNTIVQNVTYNSFRNGAGMQLSAGVTARNNIVVGNHGPAGLKSGVGIVCEGDRFGPRLECNDAWGNDGRDYLLFGTCDTTGARNFSADPLFCHSGENDFRLHKSSPCAPENNNSCGLIGAYPTSSACVVTPTRRTTWGRVKILYR